MVRLIPWFKEQGSAIIAIVGNMHSPIAEQARFVLDASVEKEADPLNLAPTASSTVALALGDALGRCPHGRTRFYCRSLRPQIIPAVNWVATCT